MKKTGYGLLAVVVIAAVAGFGYWKLAGNPDALRKIVLEQCLPNQLQHQNPAPCAEVKPDAGYVVFKDRNGPLQYLLMPTGALTAPRVRCWWNNTRRIFSGWPGNLAIL